MTAKKKKVKSELEQALFDVNREMNTELREEWWQWNLKNATADQLTLQSWRALTRGTYISKDNIPYALKALNEGKRLVKNFNEKVKSKLETISNK